MIRKSSEKQVEKKPGPFNGKGQIQMTHILNGQEEMNGKGRTFAQVTIFPGSSIGYHVHQGDGETYYILSGRGLYNHNGTPVEVGAGDVTYCAPGEGHSLECLGEEPIQMIALILYQ